MFFKFPRHTDKQYRALFQRLQCCNAVDCGGDVVGAHIRMGGDVRTKGGMKLKPCDSRIVPLCFLCHAKEGKGEKSFWGDRKPHDLASKLWLYYSVAIKHEKKGKTTENDIKVMNNIIRQWKSNE